MSPEDRETIALLCLLAAFSDGHLGQMERQQIQALAAAHGFDDLNPAGVGDETDPALLARRLSTPTARRTAFEACVAVCHADGVVTPGEATFLRTLGGALGLEPDLMARIERDAEQMTVVPGQTEAKSEGTAGETDGGLDAIILRHAMLAGAAEMLPGPLASLAIIPIQMRLVARIGQAYQLRLDAQQLKELLATAGLGVTAQMVDGLARRMVGGVARSIGGRVFGGLLGGAAGTAASAALTFATTYGIGHASLAYYSGGRRLEAVEIKALFVKLKEDGKTLYPRMEGEINRLAEKLDLQSLMDSLREGLSDLTQGSQA